MSTQEPPQSTSSIHTETETSPVHRKAGLTPRTGPIVWGCLILAFCAYVLQRLLAPESVNNVLWITGTLFGLGALLLGVGITIIARNRRNHRGN